jgi:hypothetical protein
MPSINLNQIRTGSNSVDRLVSAGQAIISNPAAGLSIAKNLINSGVLGGEGPSDPSVGGLRSKTPFFTQAHGKVGKLEDIMFPHDLDNEHYMTFRVVKTVRKKTVETSKVLKERSIILPVPGNLVAKYAADYENQDIGILGAMAAGDLTMPELKQAGSSGLSALKSMGASVIKDAKSGNVSGTAAALVGVAGATAAGMAFGTLLGAGAGVVGLAKIGVGAGKKAGLAINPHMAVLFKGVGFKEHSFSFKFIPRDQDESNDIQKLCREFRKHMLPTLELGSLAFGYPDEFQIIFSDHLSPYLFTIGNCVLKSFDVTYNGSGVPSFSKDGAPMEIDISLGFQEVAIETRNTKRTYGDSTTRLASGFGYGKSSDPGL